MAGGGRPGHSGSWPPLCGTPRSGGTHDGTQDRLEYLMVSRSILRAFADQVARAPDATAVSFGDIKYSYRELDARANRLAHRLIGLGAGPEVPVAVLMERSAELVVATLAILKTGS